MLSYTNGLIYLAVEFLTKIVLFRSIQIQKALSARMEYNTKLEQDDMEGVPDEEWNE